MATCLWQGSSHARRRAGKTARHRPINDDASHATFASRYGNVSPRWRAGGDRFQWGMSTATAIKGIDRVGTKAGPVGLGNACALEDEDVTLRVDLARLPFVNSNGFSSPKNHNVHLLFNETVADLSAISKRVAYSPNNRYRVFKTSSSSQRPSTLPLIFSRL